MFVRNIEIILAKVFEIEVMIDIRLDDSIRNFSGRIKFTFLPRFVAKIEANNQVVPKMFVDGGLFNCRFNNFLTRYCHCSRVSSLSISSLTRDVDKSLSKHFSRSDSSSETSESSEGEDVNGVEYTSSTLWLSSLSEVSFYYLWIDDVFFYGENSNEHSV